MKNTIKLQREVLGLSAGTLANLTGLSQYWAVEKIQNAFYYYCDKIQEEMTWVEAWKEFKCSDEYRDELWDLVDEFAESNEDWSDWTVEESYEGYQIKQVELEDDIEVHRIIETTYEDGTHWIEYIVNGAHYGYEITDELSEDDEEMLQDWIDDKKFDTKKLSEKKNIKECSPYLAEIIEECRQSDNEMWFVEEDEITEAEVEKLEEEVEKLGITDYVRFYEDGCAITVYGGAITQFLF